ncbi:MAG: class I SAM-dependent methyltransferase [Hyphomicrobiaceae bacterium]
MTEEKSIADHWGTGDVYGRIMDAMEAASIDPEAVTVEQMAPMDHYHARGFQATIELADELPIKSGDHIVDIGCGLGGPARYLADRFYCRVSGIDITLPFVEAANKLTALLKMDDQVHAELGNGSQLPYDDASFDGGYTLHVTMNVEDRDRFYGEAFRVLKPGAFFAITEHGLGAKGDPFYPCPWSEDGSGAFLVSPETTSDVLNRLGFVDVQIEETGEKYLSGYKRAMELTSQGTVSPFGIHIFMGKTAAAKTSNAARNIEEGRTRPIKIICRRPH